MTHKTTQMFNNTEPVSNSPVECLGRIFPDDATRRSYFTEQLREKLQDHSFRQIVGFPQGSDEDILALSDPPYYTICPNPFIEEFIQHYGKPYDPTGLYHREPYATDVSEGKNDPIYNAHSYHTKVPYKAIMHYILHYTNPGDVVLDGFAGTGMTGVAAQMCANPNQEFKMQVEQEWREAGNGVPNWGNRRIILNDLSPAATYIAYNYNTPIDISAFEREAQQLLEKMESECGWMYETRHTDGSIGRINYTVWSDVFICSQCNNEIVFWDNAVDKNVGEVHEEFPCPYCRTRLTKRNMERAFITLFDPSLNKTVQQPKSVPVLINYSVGKARFEKSPDAFDFDILAKIEQQSIPYWYPSNRMPEGDESRRNDDVGITHVHQFYTKRSLWIFSALYRHSLSTEVKCALLGGYTVGLKTARFLPLRWINKDTGPMKPHTAGTLYIPSLSGEQNWLNIFASRVQSLSRGMRSFRGNRNYSIINCASASASLLPANSIDYIFTDPPFGGNIMYSELNFIWESWIRVFTNNKSEAIVNKSQGKGLLEYQT